LRFAVLPGGKDATCGAAAAVERPTLTWRSRTPVAVAFGVAALALIGWLVSAQPAATLRGLPADQRAQLAERTLANLRDVCHGAERPRDFCREQANLVLQLPECDQVCRAQARDVLVADSAVK
jgi:hypothetical protein